MDAKHWVFALIGGTAFLAWSVMIKADMAPVSDYLQFIQYVVAASFAVALKDMK